MCDKDLKEKYRKCQNKWKPDNVKVVLIAESPPDPKGEEQLPYFYNEDSRKNQGLWKEVGKALNLNKDCKKKFLEEFMKRGYLLFDIFATYKEKEDFEETDYSGKRNKLLKRILKLIKEESPEKIVFIHKGATRCLSLPFPAGRSKRYSPDFKKGLNNILNKE